VLRDGSQVFAGMQVKLERTDTMAAEAQFIKFEFMPLARWAFWRRCLPVPPATTMEVTGNKVDDVFKWIVERTLGATAPVSPTNSVVRAVTNFQVAANKTEYPDNITLDPTNQILYEWLQRWGAHYKVDWDIYWDSDDYPEFETWYPRRGTDRTEGNGVNTEAIFTDELGEIIAVKYGHDSSDVATLAYKADMSAEQQAAAGDRTAWLIRDMVVSAMDTTTLDVALTDHRPKTWCTLEGFKESRGQQWITHFKVGDKITWRSLRMGYGPTDAIICQIDFEIDDDGFEHLKLTFGDPEPDLMDKMRGGGAGKNSPNYTDPTAGSRILGIVADDANVAYPAVGTNNWTLAGGTGASTAISGSTITVNTVWQKTAAYIHQATHGDELRIYDSGDGLAFRITGDGDVYGNAQALGSPYRVMQIIDYDIIGATAAAAGVHDITLSGNLISDVSTTASTLAWLGGSNGEDTVQVRNWSVYSDTAGSVLRARYTITAGLQLLAADGSTPVLTVHPTSGNTAWIAGAKWTIEGDEYTLPTAFPGSNGMALTGTTLGVLTWDNPLIATPGTLTVATGNAAAAPHTHAITSSSDPGAAASLLATDASGYLELVRLQLGAATAWIDLSTTTLRVNGPTYVGFYCGGVSELFLSASLLYPSTDGGLDLGSLANSFNNLTLNGNITLAGTVDGVNVSSHVHEQQACTGLSIASGGDHYHVIAAGHFTKVPA